MGKFSPDDYAEAVDRTIDQGVRFSKASGRPFDIMHFARLLWRAKPFFHRAAKGKLGGYGKAVYADLITAVASCDAKAAREVMAEMLAIAKKKRFRMPLVDHIPEPAARRRELRRQVSASDAAAARKPFAQQVDDAIARGLAGVASHERQHGMRRAYDILFFAKAMWRARPFLEHVLLWDLERGTPKRREYVRRLRVLRQDFLIAIHGGREGTVRRLLTEMEREAEMAKKGAKKRRFAPLPAEGLDFPVPKVLLN